MKMNLIVATIVTATAVGFSGAALAQNAASATANSHAAKATTAAYRPEAGAHRYENFSAEKPVNCANMAVRAQQPMKWAGFCANGGGGH